MLTKEKVLEIQEIINQNKTKKIQTETKLEASYKVALDEFACKDIESIEESLDLKDKTIESIEDQISTHSKALEDAYDWGI